MSEEMEQEAVTIITKAFEQFRTFYEISRYIRQEFEQIHSKCWTCTVGKNFTSINSYMRD